MDLNTELRLSGSEAIVILDVETGRFIDANRATEQLFGLPRDRLLEVGPFAVSPASQPAGPSRERGNEMLAEAVSGGAPVFEWWHCNAHGKRFPCEVRLSMTSLGNRDVICGSIVDVSDRKLLQISELGRRRVLDCLASEASLTETLTSLVRTIEGLLPGRICSILLLDRETNSLRLGAAPNLPDFYNAALDGLEIASTVGSCGAAALTGRRVIARDVRQHVNWVALRQLAEQAQLRACWSEPVSDLSREIVGTVAMYSREPTVPAPVELQALEIAAQLTSIVIEHDRARRSVQQAHESLEQRVVEETKRVADANLMLREAEGDARLAAVAFDTHDSIVITDKHGRILRVNRSFTELTGYTAEEAVGKTPRILKSGRHGKVFYRDMWRAIRADGHWEGSVWNKRRDGQVYLQRLTIASVKNAFGETTHYVSNGQDITASEQAKTDGAAIEAARRVQNSLFPRRAPSVSGFDIAGTLHPAESVSGDCFDFIPLGKKSLGVLVADVSGHGLGPALQMAQTQAYLRALAEYHSDPGELLTQANRLFGQSDSGRFVTILLCRLDEETRSLVYASAGHQGYLFRADGGVEALHTRHSLPLGILDGATMRSAPAISLEAGDIVLLPTDGIEESHSHDSSRLFGRERMCELVRSMRQHSAAEIVEALVGAARDFLEGGFPQDDMTAVVVKA